MLFLYLDIYFFVNSNLFSCKEISGYRNVLIFEFRPFIATLKMGTVVPKISV